MNEAGEWMITNWSGNPISGTSSDNNLSDKVSYNITRLTGSNSGKKFKVVSLIDLSGTPGVKAEMTVSTSISSA